MKAQEIRETYLSFFEERDHIVVPSASLVPRSRRPLGAADDRRDAAVQALLARPREAAGPRLADVQKCFRTTDIEEVGNTARHLTFFEMLGNWSFGDYFKEESIAWGWELSTEGFGFDPEQIWVTVFGGDEELGLGPDDEAIEIWKQQGVPEERIVQLPRSENFWQAGPTGPCGPCSELYLDRGERFGGADERPGDDTDRFLEYWNHVFMTYELHEDGSLTPLPHEQHRHRAWGSSGWRRSSRTSPRSSRPTSSGRCRAGRGALRPRLRRRRGDDAGDADHRRPLARHDLPDRRRRRALERGPRLHPAPDHAAGDPAGPGRSGSRRPGSAASPSARSRSMGDTYPELVAERETIARWVADEEESFGRTLERGTELLERLIAEAKEDRDLLDRRRGGLQAPRHLRLPLRPDQGAARRAGPLGRRPGLRGADGGAARAGPDGDRRRPRLRGPPRAR